MVDTGTGSMHYKGLFAIGVVLFIIFFFNDTATTEIYTLSLHDALPISTFPQALRRTESPRPTDQPCVVRSEEHTSELQSRSDLVCRLLLEKKEENGSKLGLIDNREFVQLHTLAAQTL